MRREVCGGLAHCGRELPAAEGGEEQVAGVEVQAVEVGGQPLGEGPEQGRGALLAVLGGLGDKEGCLARWDAP